MAGDWIKMRSNLDGDPRVVRIAEDLNLHELHVVGLLWKLWSWADQHTVDGNAPSVTASFLDRITYVSGFARSVEKVGWLDLSGGVLLPHFDEHNGQTAKNRALTQTRVKRFRNAPVVTPSLPEKRREEKIDTQTSGAPAGGPAGRPTCDPTDTHTDLPPGFPQDEKQASDQAAFVGCPPEFAVETWNLAMGRGGKDAKGRTIRSWRHHLAAAWSFNQHRTAESATTAKRANAGQPGGKAGSVWEAKTKLDLLESEMQECRNRGMRREPHGDVWDDEALREKHRKLRQQRDELKARIMA